MNEVPILCPGDWIHLAVPANDDLNLKYTFEEMKTAYGAFGVSIAVITGNERISAPVVVAIFRAKEVG